MPFRTKEEKELDEHLEPLRQKRDRELSKRWRITFLVLSGIIFVLILRRYYYENIALKDIPIAIINGLFLSFFFSLVILLTSREMLHYVHTAAFDYCAKIASAKTSFYYENVHRCKNCAYHQERIDDYRSQISRLEMKLTESQLECKRLSEMLDEQADSFE